MTSPKSCAILGHNPMRFAWGFDEEAAECHDMKMELAQQIMVLRQQGVTHFSVACDYGVGLYAAEIINALRNDDSELMLFCITPYEEQATKWTPELREHYFDILISDTIIQYRDCHAAHPAFDSSDAVCRRALLRGAKILLHFAADIARMYAAILPDFRGQKAAGTRAGAHCRARCAECGRTRCCGMPDGQYTLGGQDVFLSGGVAKLADGTLAGSATNLYDCMRKAVEFGIPKEKAILSATLIPARELGCEAEIGSIAPGKRADFVVCDQNLNRKKVYL